MKGRQTKVIVVILGLLVVIGIIIFLVFQSQISDEKEQSISSDLTTPLGLNLEVEQVVVRKAEVAGQFYPADKHELSEQINGYLDKTLRKYPDKKARILFVPHAGLSYSGQTAAWGFSQLDSDTYSRVVILSANHQHAGSQAAVYTKGHWQTPLGETEVDESFAGALIDNNSNITSNNTLFTGDHTIEVELIFLQSVLNDFKIVPVLLGQVNNETIEVLAGEISYLMDEETLLVISTDLSHYPSWEDANEVDKKTINAILTGEKDAYKSMMSKVDLGDYQNLQTLACGDDAIQVALEVAKFFGITDFEKIDYSNSGDVSGDKSRVVGYASIIGYKDLLPGAELDETTKKEALKIARETLALYLRDNSVPIVLPQNRYLYQPLGVFVTLNKDDQLRGCIGHFEPKDPLYKVIEDTAIDAATNDRRFMPVTEDELGDIEIEISIMTPKVIKDNWQDIELGKHGVVIQKGNKSGTFLPQVATDTGWSKEEFLSELCSQKAGLPKNCYKDPSVTIYTFEAQVFSEGE